MVGQPEYTVELVADTDFGGLISRDWLKWADESKPLIAGAHLSSVLVLMSPTKTR